ncbi:auxin-responsive protein IAA29-like, partial [Carica papaya]
MELQLGLALPTQNLSRGFDLNDVVIGFDHKENMESLESCEGRPCLGREKFVKNKRGFGEAFGKINFDGSQTVPLLVWNGGESNEDDDRRRGEKKSNHSSAINKNGEEENGVVGWPPIKSWRKNMFLQHEQRGGGRMNITHNNNTNQRTALMAGVAENGVGSSKPMFVKVKMEGAAIARKIDLSLYHSYQILKNSLIAMFAKYQSCDTNGVAGYTLTYQDKEGDWLLAGDLPW